jgi:hypothetical protein
MGERQTRDPGLHRWRNREEHEGRRQEQNGHQAFEKESELFHATKKSSPSAHPG